MRTWIQSLASLSGLRIQPCCELWCRLAAAAPIQPQAWELSYAVHAALKDQKKKKKKKGIVVPAFPKTTPPGKSFYRHYQVTGPSLKCEKPYEFPSMQVPLLFLSWEDAAQQLQGKAAHDSSTTWPTLLPHTSTAPNPSGLTHSLRIFWNYIPK